MLRAGYAEEYKKRHDELWPELQLLLKETGVSDYSIFLDESNGDLLGVLKVQDLISMDQLPLHPVMQKWWAFMKDIMDSNSDNSPVSISLKEVFHLD
jgi:L-rhamnose mutarotase